MILISVLSKQIKLETKVDSGGAFICLQEHHVHQFVAIYGRLMGDHVFIPWKVVACKLGLF